MAATSTTPQDRKILRRLRELGGAFRTGKATDLGITAHLLYQLRDAGHL